MTFDLGSVAGPPNEPDIEPEPPQLSTVRMISLRFIMVALRRGRPLWLGLAVIGLVAGLGYHVAVPPQYSATTTVYLAETPGSSSDVDAANDLAMVKTEAVGQAAIALLGEHDLTVDKLLGKAPGITVSDNILTITISGPTATEAVRRVNAVTTAYLDFRSRVYNAQNQSVTQAANQQIAKLQSQVNQLTSQINALNPTSQEQQYTSLVNQQSALGTQVTNLQQTVQQDDLNTLSVSKGSRVLTAGTVVHLSKIRLLAVDALSGLMAGLSLGLLIVVVRAVLSDRLRRREDIAEVLGVPVGLSIGRLRRRLSIRPSVARMASAPPMALQSLVQHLQDRLEDGGPRPTELLVAFDDVDVPAAAMGALAARLSRSGQQVVLVDATDRRVIGHALGTARSGVQKIRLGDGPEVTLLLPPLPGAPDPEGRWATTEEDLAGADAVLVLATVEPAFGAGHLRHWATTATVTVSAGDSTAQRINAIAELLAVANVLITSAVLLNTDETDESVGLPGPGPSGFGRRLGLVPATG
jgi:capsular polysaccharide biosynthesis protein